MSQIIVIHDNEKLQNLIVQNIQKYSDSEIITRENAVEAISMLQLLPDIKVVVTKSQLNEEDTALKLIKHIIEEKHESKLVVLGKVEKDFSKIGLSIEKESNWQDAVKGCLKFLGITKASAKTEGDPDNFTPVPYHYFLPLGFINCPVYGETPDGHFEIKINSDENFNKETVKKLVKEGHDVLFLQKDDFNPFLTFLSNKLVYLLEKNDVSLKEQLINLEESYDIITHKIKDLGFVSTVIQLSEALSNALINSHKAFDDIDSLLKEVNAANLDYMFKNCFLMTIIGLQMLDKFKVGNQENYTKIAQASMFHNIYLQDYPNFANIYSQKMMENKNLRNNNKKMVENHAHEAAHFLRDHNELAIGTSDIVLQHHGSIRGVGFPAEIDDKVGKLAKVFIIVEAFVEKIIRGTSLKDAKNEVGNIYSDPDAKKISSAL